MTPGSPLKLLFLKLLLLLLLLLVVVVVVVVVGVLLLLLLLLRSASTNEHHSSIKSHRPSKAIITAHSANVWSIFLIHSALQFIYLIIIIVSPVIIIQTS